MQLQPTRISINFEPALIAVLDAYRREVDGLPSRAEAIRRAVRALATQPTTSTRKPRGKAPREPAR
jgi:metal-responsive CopG/Arc/MetJ family transcriptional regulator